MRKFQTTLIESAELEGKVHGVPIVGPQSCVFQAKSVDICCFMNRCQHVITDTDCTGFAPSMSTLLPRVRFHCLPARAIRRRRLSPSTDFRCAGGSCRAVEFAARSVDSVPPEKKAWML